MPLFIRSASALATAAVLLAACDRSSTGSLFPTAPTSPSSPAGAVHTLYGAVTASGKSAVGASVAVLEMDPEPTATTDHNGAYRIAGLPTSSVWGRTLVRFSLPGYFTVFKRPSIGGDTKLDVDLDPLVFISVEEIVRGTVTADDASCAGKEYDEDPCVRYAVRALLAGTLEVTLMSDAAVALDVVNPEGRAFAEFSGSRKRVSIPAQSGGIYEMRVVAGRRDVPKAFDLTVSVR